MTTTLTKPTPSVRIKNSTIKFTQVCLFCIFSWACHIVAIKLNSPIPGSVIGLAVLLILLSMKLVPEKMVNNGATWLISDLLLFFIPPVVSVIKYQDILEHFGTVLLSSMLIASTIVLLGTAFTVDRLFKFEHQYRAKKQLQGAI
ncbi:CidA/LrgA family protein [Shewanella intestini]|uniref:CidA/LrgA family protein n=1 Tax=Shewanella intestini TaxID=2017544 RepID=A0ABS5HXS0_9GAMM|nr:MULTISPECIES: CidA/LrgA family protein [Shewanella]MBR9726555.1 CidA/LrgA family protein [Shewanella intestini]MRG34879.1 CidA/LrgA family protein [Shewanella sp. XMDDZSB0408]